MKKLSKLLMIALALVLILALVACDSENNGDETKSPADTGSETNTPNDSDNVTDDSNGTQDPSDTSKDPSNDTADAATGTNKPEQPTEPEDPDKTAKIVDSVNKTVEALANSIGGQTGSELPSVSLDSLVELFKTLDFQVTGIPNLKGAFVVKNGMVSYSEYDRNVIELPGEEPVVSVSKYIYKLYSDGLAMVETDEYGQIVSGGFSSFEDSGVRLPNISIDFAPVLNALKLAKDDIKADVEKQTYTFSDSYLTRVSNAIYDLVKSSGEQISVLGVNENNVISSLVLDFGKFESEGKISATAKIGKTGKEIVLDLTVGDTNFEMNVECKDMFTFNMKLSGTQEVITSFELNAELSSANLKLAVKGSRAENTSFEATLSDLKSTALITVAGTSKTETNGKTAVNVEIAIDVEKIGTAFGGSTEKLYGDSASDGVKKVNIKIGCTVIPNANGAPDINVSASVTTDGTEMLTGELYISASAITTPSKECASLNIAISNLGKLSASVKTVAYSEKGFEYQINVDYSSGIYTSEKLQISVKAPSTIEIELTDIEKVYIGNADKIAADYQKVKDKIDELNALANAYLNSNYNPENGDPDSFFTEDKETGLIYVTHIWQIWDDEDKEFLNIRYEAHTYVELGGPEEFRDDMAENLGDFKNYKKPFGTTANEEIESVLAKEFDALGDAFSYEKADYYVCCKDPDTDTYYVFECYMSYTFGWRTFDHKPTADEIGGTSVHWYTLGTGKIHSFATSSTGHTCSDCGLSLMDISSIWHS